MIRALRETMNLVVAASFIPQEKPQRNHKQAFGPTQQGPGLFDKSKTRSGKKKKERLLFIIKDNQEILQV